MSLVSLLGDRLLVAGKHRSFITEGPVVESSIPYLRVESFGFMRCSLEGAKYYRCSSINGARTIKRSLPCFTVASREIFA